MSATADSSAQQRVLVLAPTPKDAARTLSVLAGADVEAVACPDLGVLCRGVAAGAGAAILTEEAVMGDRAGTLAAAVREQPSWSDVPLVVLTGGGADSAAAAVALETLGNVTLLDRPVRVATLVSTVRAALRSRRKQYEVRDYLAERARVADALEDAAVRKDEFLATLAHELRNPLAPIRNALQIMRLARDGPVVERNRALIERQVEQLVRLVDDLLDVSRAMRGKVTLHCERVDLAAVAANAVETAQPLIDAQGHALTVSPSAEPVPIDADPLRLVQVVANLLTNAAKYTERGGRIGLSVAREGGAGVVRVRDSGIGIAPDLLPHVFDLFVQADHSATRSRGGLGIGLTLVRTLVEMHGGSVEARSAGLGRGSEFVVRLPLATGPSPG
jgi:signal transduction histidine kinase